MGDGSHSKQHVRLIILYLVFIPPITNKKDRHNYGLLFVNVKISSENNKIICSFDR